MTIIKSKSFQIEAMNDVYLLKHYLLIVELPAALNIAGIDVGDAFYSISIEGRDAPMRTVTLMDQSDLGDDMVLRFTTYRTIATVEIIKRSPHA